jgi:hypothetical protein
MFLVICPFKDIISQELASQEEISLYSELLKQSGESLFMPSPEDYQKQIMEYVEEIYYIQNQLSEFYKILNVLGYVNKNNITEMEFRTYKEHFFERKEMEVFTEYLRIEWKDKYPEWIIFRSRSSMMPKLNTRNTLFVLPRIEKRDSVKEHHKEQFIEPPIQVLASIAYSAGMGEKYHFYLPPVSDSNPTLSNYRIKFQIFDFVLNDVPPKIINEPPLKILTLQYIVYRLRYLDLKIRTIIKNKIIRNRSEFYRSIPDSRY